MASLLLQFSVVRFLKPGGTPVWKLLNRFPSKKFNLQKKVLFMSLTSTLLLRFLAVLVSVWMYVWSVVVFIARSHMIHEFFAGRIVTLHLQIARCLPPSSTIFHCAVSHGAAAKRRLIAFGESP